MKASTYNGWANRETWLVNLYYSEDLTAMVESILEDGTFDIEQKEENIKWDLVDEMKGYFEAMIEDETNKLSSFLSDYIDFSLIEWKELADCMYDDTVKPFIEEQEEEEEEEE